MKLTAVERKAEDVRPLIWVLTAVLDQKGVAGVGPVHSSDSDGAGVVWVSSFLFIFVLFFPFFL